MKIKELYYVLSIIFQCLIFSNSLFSTKVSREMRKNVFFFVTESISSLRNQRDLQNSKAWYFYPLSTTQSIAMYILQLIAQVQKNFDNKYCCKFTA